MRLVGTILLGVIGGLGVGAIIGTVATVALTISGWPGSVEDPTEKSRHLAEAIAEGMYLALLAALVAAPVCTFVVHLARRTPGGNPS